MQVLGDSEKASETILIESQWNLNTLAKFGLE